MQKTPQDEFIHFLTQEHSYSAIRKLLTNNVQLIAPDSLFMAINVKRIDIVKLLLELGVDCNATDLNKNTALHYAATDERLNILKLLCEWGSIPKTDRYGKTPLDYALETNELLTAHYLLQRYTFDFDIELIKKLITDSSISTQIRNQAYLYLIAKGTLEDVKQLAPLVDANYCDDGGNNAFLVACFAGRADVLPWLIQRGFSFKCRNNHGFDAVLSAVAGNKKEMLSILLKTYLQTLQVTAVMGFGPVLVAVYYGHQELLADLVSPIAKGGFGLDLNTIDKYGRGPVLIAIGSHRLEMLRTLIFTENGKFYGLSLDVRDVEGNGPVLAAIRTGSRKLLTALVNPNGEFGLTLKVKNNQGIGPVLTAVGCGNEKMLADLVDSPHQGGFGLTLDEKDIHGNCPVLIAASCGQKGILARLLAPKNEGGYNLTLDVKNLRGGNPVSRAMVNNQLEMLEILVSKDGYGLILDPGDNKQLNPIYLAVVLDCEKILRQLVKPKSEGGLGLLLNHHNTNVVSLALLHNKTKLLIQLLTPVEKGGFGCRLDIDSQWNNMSVKCKEASLAIFIFCFDNIVEKELDIALKWVSDHLKHLAFASAELNTLLSTRYQELLKFYLDSEQTSEVEKIANALESIAPGKANLVIANYYAEARQFVATFEHYLTIYKDLECYERQSAGFEMANLILNGDVILSENGTLDEQQTTKQFHNLSEDHLNKRKGCDLAQMQDRAIKAYEYVHDNNFAGAAFLLNRLDSILGGNLTPEVNRNNWDALAIKKFRIYYKQKDSSVLLAPAYVAAIDALVDQHADLIVSKDSTKNATLLVVDEADEKYHPKFF